MSPASSDSREPIASAPLLVSAAPAMQLLGPAGSIDQHQQYASTSYQQQMSNLALASTAPATAVAASLGAVGNGAKRALKSPTAGSAKVKAGGVHKSKASTSSVSSTSTVGSRHQRAASAGSERADSDEGTPEQGSDGGGPQSQEQQRRRRFLERNRVAASKCRQKKKMWVQELERRAEDVTMQNRSLHIAVAQLKEEVMILKNQLLAHRNCNCSAIHQYLQAECVVGSDASVPLTHPPTLVSPPPPPHAPAMAAAVAAAAGTTAAQPLLLHQQAPHAQPMMMQPQPQHFRNQPVYAPHVSHHHASSVDLSMAPNAPMPAMINTTAAQTAAAAYGPSSVSPRP
ncbi:hypothetical protein IWW50_002912 [Coemansia erecta]|nr:hypothetical protein GGF43_003186 [Coemansia sp. RSA 2618]KAJ2825306.1 hypothetical protein IWW50_002912 [Coemansia erecta]